MTYDDIEKAIGNPVREPSTTSSDWDRYNQTFRRRAIRAAEMQAALDLLPEAIPNLVFNESVELDSNFNFNLSTLTFPLLKLLNVLDSNKNPLVVKPFSDLGKVNYQWRGTKAYIVEIDKLTHEYKIFNDTAYGDVDPQYHYLIKPQTHEMFVPAILKGGTGALTTLSTWLAIDDGEFKISIDDDEQSIKDLDFTADDVTMADVAETIQDGLQVIASGGFTDANCIWDEVNGRFIIISGSTSGKTNISAITDPEGVGTYIGSSTHMDCESTATNLEILAGETGFEFGDQRSELSPWEDAIILYASHYMKKMDNQYEDAEVLLKDYYRKIQFINNNHKRGR